MQLLSVETTPNPNSMKLNLDTRFNDTQTYTLENQPGCPAIIDNLLGIEGVVSVFVCANFLTMNRDPRQDWQSILENVARFFEAESVSIEIPKIQVEPTEEIQVSVLMFKGVPMQIKASDATQEKRVGLSQRFTQAVEIIRARTNTDFIKERSWADEGTRYGSLEDVLAELTDEIEGLYPPDRIERVIAEALGEKLSATAVLTQNLESLDWKERFQTIQALDATEESLAVFVHALEDEKPQIRRWAAAKLGTIGSAKAVPFLMTALTDSNVGVRRTAGDSLSDIGDLSAQLAMCQALSDENKLVRWRAARYLSEVGNQDAISFLENALEDPEYEVRLEVQSALQRIQSQDTGPGTSGPIWKQMAQDSEMFRITNPTPPQKHD